MAWLPPRTPGPRAFRCSGARGLLMDQHTQVGLEPLELACSFQAVPLGAKERKCPNPNP